MNFHKYLGEFWSSSAKRWITWDGSCSDLCSYQSACFVWPPGELLDLDTMAWVPAWDSDTQISITDPQLDNVPLWRSFTYYIDFSSESVTELGTIDHPYKELRSAFVELFSFHSHTERDITIKIREETVNYIPDQSIILNITNVQLESYSKTSEEPKRAEAIVVELESDIVLPTTLTRYKILRKP